MGHRSVTAWVISPVVKLVGSLPKALYNFSVVILVSSINGISNVAVRAVPVHL